MNRRVVSAPGYENIMPDILRLVDSFDRVGEVIYRGHNIIKVADVPGIRLNIKRYRVPNLLNRLVYSFIRKPKGVRAFAYAEILRNRGIGTPAPVAYIEERRYGFIAFSYLVTVQVPLSRDLYEFGDKDMTNPGDVMIVKSLAHYVARMHQAGILHRDLSPGNVIFDINSDGLPEFMVVDINRMSIGNHPVSIRSGLRDMARLWGQPEMFDILADEYASARGADFRLCRRVLHEARRRFWTRFARRHTVKYNLRFT